MTEQTADNAAFNPPLTRSDSSGTAFESWVGHRLKNEWSSSELGSLLTKERIADAVTRFQHLETPVKVRFLLSFLSVRDEEMEESKTAIEDIVAAAEKDTEEWVKIAAGTVRQYLLMSRQGEKGDSFLLDQLEASSDKILEAVSDPTQQTELTIDNFVSFESAILNPSVRPEMAIQPTQHFTLVEVAESKEEPIENVMAAKKPIAHRNSISRPPPSASVATSQSRGSISSTSQRPPRGRKHVTELSEIRRKADAGRFKRQRSRISMIDIDEVKQIESDKAQRAEERKKQKAVPKEKGQMSAPTQSDGENRLDMELHDNGEADTVSALAEGLPMPMPDPSGPFQQIEYPYAQPPPTNFQQINDVGNTHESYVPDGTQALLNAAFHTQHDMMTEVVGSHSQSSEQDTSSMLPTMQQRYVPQTMYQHPPDYHRGFEPEDAGSMQMNYGQGFTNSFGGHFNAPSGFAQPRSFQQGFGDGMTQPQGFMEMQADETHAQQQPPPPDQYQRGYDSNSSEFWR